MLKLRSFGRGGIGPHSQLAATGPSDSRAVVLYALSLSFMSLTSSCLTFVATLSLSVNSRIKYLPECGQTTTVTAFSQMPPSTRTRSVHFRRESYTVALSAFSRRRRLFRSPLNTKARLGILAIIKCRIQYGPWCCLSGFGEWVLGRFHGRSHYKIAGASTFLFIPCSQ